VDLRGGAVDLAQIVRRQLDVGEPVHFRGARNRGDPRLLREQSRQRDLCRRRILARADTIEQIRK
jgi:hypothetical protein